MTRALSIALVLALLGGTAAAFAITERLKLERTPITGTRVSKRFSPLAEGGGTAEVYFRLRKRDRISVEIVDARNEVVATLISDVLRSRGPVRVTWDGRDEEGRMVAEGRYKPRLRLDRARRTILLPNPIEIDLTAPRITFASVRPRVISPDHDGRVEFARVRFRVDEPARALLLVNGRQHLRSQIERERGKLNWFGTLDGRPLPAGEHTLTLRAEDRAGNRSVVTAGVKVRVRYVELRVAVIRARPGARLRVPVSTGARRVTWRLAGRARRVERRTLRLRAPRRPGRYTLYATANGHGDRATVIVRPP